MPGVDHFYLQEVVSFLEGFRNVHLIGGSPCYSTVYTVYPDVGNVFHIGDAEPRFSCRFPFMLEGSGVECVSAEIAYPVIGMLTPVEKLLFLECQAIFAESDVISFVDSFRIV